MKTPRLIRNLLLAGTISLTLVSCGGGGGGGGSTTAGNESENEPNGSTAANSFVRLKNGLILKEGQFVPANAGLCTLICNGCIVKYNYDGDVEKLQDRFGNTYTNVRGWFQQLSDNSCEVTLRVTPTSYSRIDYKMLNIVFTSRTDYQTYIRCTGTCSTMIYDVEGQVDRLPIYYENCPVSIDIPIESN